MYYTINTLKRKADNVLIYMQKSKFRQVIESLLDETLDKVNLVLKNPNIVKAIQEKIDNDYSINTKISPKDLLLYFDDALDNNKYIPWVTKRYISNDFVANQIDEINNLLNRFVQNLNKIENKDIGFYKSIDELKDVIRTAENTDLSNSEKARIAKTEAKKVYEDNDLVIIVPETEAAAIQYGKGTKWCTSALNDNRFETYDGISPLYININKHNGNKYQFWEGENGIEFRNAANDPVDLFDTLLKPYPNLAKYYYEIFKRSFPLNLDSSYIPMIKGALYHKIASQEEISQFLYDQFKKYNYPDAIEPFIEYMSKEHLNKLGMKIQESKFRKMSRFRQIVENQLNTYGYSLYEDAKKDNEYLRHSIDVFDEYIAKLAKQIDPEEYYFDSNLDLSVELNEDFGNVAVVIVFEPENDRRVSYGTYDKNGIIQIILGNIFDLNKEANTIKAEDPIMRDDKISILGKDILHLMNSNNVRSTFIHEYQHFIDDKQRNYLKKSSDKLANELKNLPYDHSTEDYKKLYYNSAHENNAHYMRLLHDISVELKKQANRNLALLTPEQRLELFLHNISRQGSDFRELYKSLNKRLQRRLISRLYKYFSADFWDERRKEIDDKEFNDMISELFSEA